MIEGVFFFSFYFHKNRSNKTNVDSLLKFLEKFKYSGLTVIHYLNNVENIGIFIRNIYVHKVLKLCTQYIYI